MSTYEDIFNQRGNMYHYAMQKYPNAREEEFLNLLQYSDIKKEDVIADIPSGGCYLKKYISCDFLYHIDSSIEFLNMCCDILNTAHCQIDNTPFKKDFFDKVYSLAGTHHLDDKKLFFKEVKRVLKNKGKFIYADVQVGSKEDKFLNIFVDKYNKMGHKGLFIDANTISLMNKIGLTVQESKYKKFFWNFKSEKNMVDFIKNLFGLDLAQENEIFNAVKTYLGYKKEKNIIRLNWGLLYIYAKKDMSS